MDCLTKLQSTKSTNSSKSTLKTKIKNKNKTGASVISLCELVIIINILLTSRIAETLL